MRKQIGCNRNDKTDWTSVVLHDGWTDLSCTHLQKVRAFFNRSELAVRCLKETGGCCYQCANCKSVNKIALAKLPWRISFFFLKMSHRSYISFMITTFCRIKNIQGKKKQCYMLLLEDSVLCALNQVKLLSFSNKKPCIPVYGNYQVHQRSLDFLRMFGSMPTINMKL